MCVCVCACVRMCVCAKDRQTGNENEIERRKKSANTKENAAKQRANGSGLIEILRHERITGLCFFHRTGCEHGSVVKEFLEIEK